MYTSSTEPVCIPSTTEVARPTEPNSVLEPWKLISSFIAYKEPTEALLASNNRPPPSSKRMSPSSSCARYTEQSLSLNVEMIPDTVPALFTLVSLSTSSISEPCLNSLLVIFVISS